MTDVMINVATRIAVWGVRMAGLFVLCSGADALSQDTLAVTTNFYQVYGITARQLRESIEQSRPWKDDAGRDADTRWKIEWSFRFKPTEQSCQLEAITTKTTITLTLPKWTATAQVPPALGQRWTNYLHALNKHEEGHKQFAHATAAEIRKRVKALKPEPTCDALSASINSTAENVVKEFRRKETDYDRTTDHGATQGARFF